MAIPFKLTLVGKFSYNHPRMELIRKYFSSLGLNRNSQISLFDNRHILIKLNVEEDYTRLWVKQIWYVYGSAMRILNGLQIFGVLRSHLLFLYGYHFLICLFISCNAMKHYFLLRQQLVSRYELTKLLPH